ncbi:M3 family oligoendopeptidase [Brevibacillus dissolubilis]|uniref:M3 family oligoendopeptidase n=1 Tax=Brevibacillus dissolubilis TaxID=1844116 RepID=UPI001116075F|nr:M3 family oligoendopeptidase [Brevibacillus dissolubilis]
MANFYIETFSLADPQELEQRLQKLVKQELTSAQDLEQWLREKNELFNHVQEILNGHYADFQCRTDDETAQRNFEHDQEVILPLLTKYEAELNEKFEKSPYLSELDPAEYGLLIRKTKNALELFREENIPLSIEESRLVTEYFNITGNINVEWEGEEKTLEQIYPYLKDSDRTVREKAWRTIQGEYSKRADQLEEIMDQLIRIRHQKAQNAGLANYRDYMFKEYERFDYTPEDCFKLGEAVKKQVVPFKVELEKAHQAELGVDKLRPWDTDAVPAGKKPLKPFSEADELIAGTTRIFDQMDPDFTRLLRTMDERGMLDLSSRKGKAPGGFCIPLPVSELSFIFMNSVGTQRDVQTLVHEMGHCIHNDLKKTLAIDDYKDVPMESAELASMSMEYFTMEGWSEFYNEADLARAKKEQLESFIYLAPRMILIDAFQHWMYENPNHTREERTAKYQQLFKEYLAPYIDWSGEEDKIVNSWYRVLHIFEVPFYYIEYLIANIGALQMYKQYKENPEQALANYKKALTLGASKSLPEVYAAAGITFDFSEEMLTDLVAFTKKELELIG